MKKIALMIALMFLAVSLVVWAFGCSETTDSSEDDGTSDTDTDTDADADGGMIGDFGEDCNVDNDQCEGVCVEFNQLGEVCTMVCEEDSDCPPDAKQCNKNGYCRPPDPA